MDRKPAIAAVPISFVAPMTEPTKVKKKKSTAKNPNQTPPKVFKPKQTKKKPFDSGNAKRKFFEQGIKIERKNANVGFDNPNLDFSGVPSPYCSCTGVVRGCYKCGGGWQSSCCTTNISEFPLPVSPVKPGARVTGRKMSSGAYEKLLFRLAAEGHDLSQPVDLKDHWARHGTNKFVTIK
ncbi:hypothetical protein U1Q18_021587 [Sarracenia purpurea var. burkii]